MLTATAALTVIIFSIGINIVLLVKPDRNKIDPTVLYIAGLDRTIIGVVEQLVSLIIIVYH